MALALIPILSGCGLLFRGASEGSGSVEDRAAPQQTEEREGMIPAGYGTLRQDDITMALDGAELQVKVTPLVEEIIRVTAPDTYERLSGLAHSHRELLERRAPGRQDAKLFLVSLFSEIPDTTFEPEDLNLMSRGFRHRPLTIFPVTPGWTTGRLQPRRTEMAVYAFDSGLDLEGDIEVEYREHRSRSWERILPRIEVERSRVRARAAGARQTSSPYFRILR